MVATSVARHNQVVPSLHVALALSLTCLSLPRFDSDGFFPQDGSLSFLLPQDIGRSSCKLLFRQGEDRSFLTIWVALSPE
jgi:hypothetical protein